MTFCHKDDLAHAPTNLMHRKSQQFHWFNKNYKGFDDFLADLSANKRKNIRKERKEAQAFGGQIHLLTGSAIKTTPLGCVLAVLPRQRVRVNGGNPI